MLLEKVLRALLDSPRIEMVRMKTYFTAGFRSCRVHIAARTGRHTSLTEQQINLLLREILVDFPGIIHQAEYGRPGRIVISAPGEQITILLHPSLLSAANPLFQPQPA